MAACPFHPDTSQIFLGDLINSLKARPPSCLPFAREGDMCRPSRQGFSNKPCLSLCLCFCVWPFVGDRRTHQQPPPIPLATPSQQGRCIKLQRLLHSDTDKMPSFSPALSPNGRLVDGVPTEPETWTDTGSISDETCIRTSCSCLPPISCWPCNSWPAPTQVKTIFSHSCSE